MRLHIDYDRCEGHGLCADRGPTVFELDDDGELIVLIDEHADIPDGLVAATRAAIASCPVAALRETP